MNGYRIYMKFGMMYEAEARNEITALQKVWWGHYKEWDFVDFCKQIEKTVRV